MFIKSQHGFSARRQKGPLRESEFPRTSDQETGRAGRNRDKRKNMLRGSKVEIESGRAGRCSSRLSGSIVLNACTRVIIYWRDYKVSQFGTNLKPLRAAT